MAAPPPLTGGAMQQLPPTTSPPIIAPKLDVQQGQANVIPQYEPGSLKLVVKSLQITGSQAFSEADLIVVADFKAGSALTLAELRSMALKIEKFYHAKGYIVTTCLSDHYRAARKPELQSVEANRLYRI